MTDNGGSRYDAAANYRALHAEVRRLRGLLKRLEWAGRDSNGERGLCPACDGMRHDPGCWLAAELRAVSAS